MFITDTFRDDKMPSIRECDRIDKVEQGSRETSHKTTAVSVLMSDLDHRCERAHILTHEPFLQTQRYYRPNIAYRLQGYLSKYQPKFITLLYNINITTTVEVPRWT